MSKIVNLKKSIKSNSALENIIRRVMRPYFWFCWQRGEFQAWLRKKGISPSKKYEYIKSMKNTHVGERCFVVATGPSLTFEDLNALKDEFCFGMNSCVLALDKTEWTPQIVGCEDEYVYEKIEARLLEESKDRLKGRVLISHNVEQFFPSAKQFMIFPQNILDHKYDLNKYGTIKFSDDCHAIVYDAWSILFSLLQFAVYMGFKEIYLIGADCNYNNGNSHFIDHGVKDSHAFLAGRRLIYCHERFKEFADSKGVKVYNCTRGGMLEVYPRKTLEDVLSQEKNRI